MNEELFAVIRTDKHRTELHPYLVLGPQGGVFDNKLVAGRTVGTGHDVALSILLYGRRNAGFEMGHQDDLVVKRVTATEVCHTEYVLASA